MEDRRDDWNNSVDERLVNLNSAQGTTDIQLANIERELTQLDSIIRGDPRNGLIEKINHLDTEVNKFNAIFDKDYLGHGGLVSFINYLHDQEKFRDRRSGYRWNWLNTMTVTLGTIICALLALAGSLFLNWDRLTMLIHSSTYAPSTQFQKEIDADKKRRRARAAGKKAAVELKGGPLQEGGHDAGQ